MNKTPTPPELAACVAFGLSHAPGSIGIARMRSVTVETRRANRKRGSEARLAVNEEVIKALRGSPEDGPEIIIITIPRDVCDDFEEYMEAQGSQIIRPGAVIS